MASGSENCDRVLVLAPQFPAINQPWIDTYLEQLLRNQFDPIIYSSKRSPGRYQSKVDLLNLRDYVMWFSISRNAIIKSFLINALSLKMLFRWRSVRDALNRLGPAKERFALLNLQPFLRHDECVSSFSVIHSHDEIQGFRFRHFSALRNVPLITTFHGLPPSGVGNLSGKKRKMLYQYAAVVLVNTEFAKQQVCKLGCDEGKVRVIPQGLPIYDFPFVPHALPDVGESLEILTVGRFHRDKGQGYALLALKRLINEGLNVQWTFVGVGQDISRLKKLVASLGLEDCVTFLEGVDSDELLEQYKRAHIFVLPSNVSPGAHIETQGVVLQEAQATGCVPIASKIGGIPECINHRQDGLLVRQKSSREIFLAVKELMAHPEAWRQYQEAGRANVEHKFSADVVGRKMSGILKEVASNWKT